jgi:hypothetical protein
LTFYIFDVININMSEYLPYQQEQDPQSLNPLIETAAYIATTFHGTEHTEGLLGSSLALPLGAGGKAALIFVTEGVIDGSTHRQVRLSGDSSGRFKGLEADVEFNPADNIYSGSISGYDGGPYYRFSQGKDGIVTVTDIHSNPCEIDDHSLKGYTDFADEVFNSYAPHVVDQEWYLAEPEADPKPLLGEVFRAALEINAASEDLGFTPDAFMWTRTFPMADAQNAKLLISQADRSGDPGGVQSERIIRMHAPSRSFASGMSVKDFGGIEIDVNLVETVDSDSGKSVWTPSGGHISRDSSHYYNNIVLTSDGFTLAEGSDGLQPTDEDLALYSRFVELYSEAFSAHAQSKLKS